MLRRMRLVRAALRNPYSVIVFALFLAVAGTNAMRRIPVDLPPMVMPFDPTASVPVCLLSVSSATMTCSPGP